MRSSYDFDDRIICKNVGSNINEISHYFMQKFFEEHEDEYYKINTCSVLIEE